MLSLILLGTFIFLVNCNRERSKPKGTIEHYTERIEKDPKDSEAYHYRGIKYNRSVPNKIRESNILIFLFIATTPHNNSNNRLLKNHIFDLYVLYYSHLASYIQSSRIAKCLIFHKLVL
ncbi:hypothetical protein ES703_112748 [subsurface metagenome]